MIQFGNIAVTVSAVKQLTEIKGDTLMTLEKLKKIQPYITEYHIDVTQKDVDIVNKAIKMMSRKPRQLAAGDIVQFSNGVKISHHAIIEDCRHKHNISICQSGSAWVSHYGKKYLSVSGGAFYDIDIDDLEYVGRERNFFSEWGSCGACASGAISVPVMVNVWKHKSVDEFKPKGNRITYYQHNFLDCQRNPDIKPEWIYAIWYADETSWSGIYHVASFKNENQLKAFADKLGFTYTWEEEREDGYKSGRCSVVIENDSVDKCTRDEWNKNSNIAYDKNASKKARENAQMWLDNHFKDICQAYSISQENLSKATKFKCLSNGLIVDGYFLNDGQRVKIYRCNPNARDFYKPLTTEEHINFVRTYGSF